MGGLVQQPTAPGAHRQHTAGRSRGALLRHAGTPSNGSLTQTNQPPANPGRFIKGEHDHFTRSARGNRTMGGVTKAYRVPLAPEELAENAAAIGPEHERHAHQRTSGHHARRYRQGEFFGELRYTTLKQKRNEGAQKKQKPIVPIEYPGESE